MDGFLRDLRHALRGLGKSPGFAAVAILTLALGIAANTTVFSWVQTFMLRPLPGVPDQERVLVLAGQSRSGDLRAFSVPDVRDLQAADLPMSVAAFDMQTMNLAGRERPERVWVALVTGNLFEVLDVRPALGRSFRPEEDRTAATHPVVVLGHRFWQSRFESDPEVVGREIQLNNRVFTVVGVAPEGFAGPLAGLAMDLYVPLAMQPVVVSGQSFLEQRGSRWLDALVRLDEGVTVEEAQAAIDTVATRLGRDFPDVNSGIRFLLYSFAKSPTGATSYLAPVLTVLVGMVGLVLLIACANVANLLLVRALGRRWEVAIRLALGAGRGRLVRQLLAESLVLVVLAGALGLLASRWGTGLMAALIPPTDAPVAPTFALDGRVLAFACGLSLLTGVLFSLAPALQVASPRVAMTLREEGGAASAGGRKARLRSALVVAQIALSAVLLIAAGLFVRSLGKAAEMDPGFSARDVLLASVDLFPNGYDEARGTAFFRRLLERTAALPGVESSSLTNGVPLDFGGSNSTNVTIDGYEPAADEEMFVTYNQVGPGYLRTMGIGLVAGRDFTPRDDAAAPPAVIINETMARRYWPGRNPVGARMRMGGKDRTVIGVARDGKYMSLGEPPLTLCYIPVLQDYRPEAVILLRTSGDPLGHVQSLRQAVEGLDPNLPIAAVKSMEEHLRISVFAQRLAAAFLGSFGLLALLLAALGLYSVIRYAVGQRTRELGVRAALGARPGDLGRLVLRQGMLLVLIGLAIGVAVALAATRLLASQLLGVSATDPLVFVAVPVLLALVAALACFLPARHAAAVNPMVALRAE